MEINKYLKKISQEIKYKPIQEEIVSEIESHINEKKEDFLRSGYTDKEAEIKAIKEMGEPNIIGKELNKIHKPKFNFWLFSILVILSICGILTSLFKYQDTRVGYLGNTILYMSLSILIGIAVYFFDYKKIQKFSNIIYIIGIIFMLLSLVGLSIDMNGRQYIRILHTTFSPCIIAIPMFIISIASFYSKYNKKNIKIIKICNSEISLNLDFIKILMTSLFSIILTLSLSFVEYAIILSVIYLTFATINICRISENKVKHLYIMYGILLAIVLSAFLLQTTGKISINMMFTRDINFIETKNEILGNANYFGKLKYDLSEENQVLISNDSNYTILYLISKIGKVPTLILILLIYITNIILVSVAKKVKDIYGKNVVIGLNLLIILQSVFNIINLIFNFKFDINIPLVSYGTIYYIINIIIFSYILSIYRRKNIISLKEKDYYCIN